VRVRILLGSLLLLCAGAGVAQDERAAFIAQTAQEFGLDEARIDSLLADAVYQQSIIDAITRPAESKPWSAYRPIFLTPARIADGRAFLAEHQAALASVQADTGVPAELIVAILGIETNYGRNRGRYRVLDALYTLGFHYPPRQAFFRKELGELFALAKEESLDLKTLQGSYAGAMGWGQFMPSSYRHFARDGDGDGQRDLFASLPDVFASVANYFIRHQWQPGQPVVVRASVAADATAPAQTSYEPVFPLAELATRGIRPQTAVGADLPASVIVLDGVEGPEHWLGFRNFYSITRYNRSPMYAMAVHQLAQELVVDAAVVAP
jgi:membrane-bound lytic murein transglycosylase B